MGRPTKQLPPAPAGARRQWAADRAMRAPMRSPGRPEPSRAVQREFWRVIATGVTTVEASAGVGVSWPVGARWRSRRVRWDARVKTKKATINGVDISNLNRSREWARAIVDARANRTVMLIKQAIAEKKSS